MDEHEDVTTIVATENLGFWDQHRYLLLIELSIVISIVLVIISMYLYFSSGAAQLDLSRPGYSAVAEQVESDSRSFQEYSALGDINQATIGEFKQLFDEQSAKATGLNAFSGDPLSPDALEISDPSN